MSLKRLKAPAFASLALAFASFGDAFLYPFLPVNNSVVGVPVVWVGALLSINRFVRIICNGWMVQLCSKYGLRMMMIVAVIIAIASTAGYAFAGSILVWLCLRICWGLAFSAMRVCTLGYAIGQERQGFTLGLTKSIQEAGPMVALLLTTFLVSRLSTSNIFLVLFVLSLPALFFAWNLPVTDDKPEPVTVERIFTFPSTINTITFLSAILIDGIIIVVLGGLFLRYSVHITALSATGLAAFYLGYRRICLVLLSPFAGWIADKLGLNIVFNFSMTLLIAGMLILAAGWVEIGCIIVFMCYSVNTAITPALAVRETAHSLRAVAMNATWRDLGAAIGTLAGGLLLTSSYLNTTLIFSTFVLLIFVLVHFGKNETVRKSLPVWK